MIKQITTFLTNLLTKTLGLITKAVDGIDANLNLIVVNPNKLIATTFFAFLVSDIIFGGSLNVITTTIDAIKSLGSVVTWPVTVLAIAVTTILNKK